jgi:ribosomal protein S18 acetylase RimI-like enzyme
MPILRPMTSYEYAEWLKHTIPVYAADKVASGQWSEEESLQLSKKGYEELLPHGLTTPDNFLYMIEDSDSTSVGVLWFAVKTMFNARIAYVYDVEVQAHHRRKGHAYRAFCALEQEARRLGLSGIALHVFGHNVDAQALYAKLGFRPTNINLFKPVTSAIAD